MLKSLGLLPVAALCLMTLAANQGLAQGSSAKPVGTWERSTKEGHFLLTIKEDRLHIRFEKSNERTTTVDADYSVSRDGILFGVVIFAEKDLGSDEDREVKSDLPFCCRYRVDGDELTIRDGKITDGDLDKLAGRYHRVEEKVSSTKPVCEEKWGCCLGGGLRIVVPTLDAKPVCEQKTGCCPAATFTQLCQEFRLEHAALRLRVLARSRPALSKSVTKFAARSSWVLLRCPSQPPARRLRPMRRFSALWNHRRLASPICMRQNRDDIQIVKELIVDRVDDARFYPLVGPARLHHCHFKCTVNYNETISSSFPFPILVKRPRVEVVYIDKDHLHLAETAK